jgi:hypothetical protein
MNAMLPNSHPHAATGCDTELLHLVAFKWLMAGIGWQVDVPRLRKDADYARVCARRGLESGQSALGARAAELLAALPARSRSSFTLSNNVRI